MLKEKIRVYSLARELDMESKDLLDLCRQAGFDVKNQLSSLDPEQRDQIVLLVKRKGSVAAAPPPKHGGSVLTQPSQPMRNLTTAPRPVPPPSRVAPKPEPTPAPAPTVTPAVEVPSVPPSVEVAPVPVAPSEAPIAAQILPTEAPSNLEPPAADREIPAPVVPAATAPTEPGPAPVVPPESTRVADLSARVRTISPTKAEGPAGQKPKRVRPTLRPVTGVFVNRQAPLKPPKPAEEKKPKEEPRQVPLKYLTKEMEEGKKPVNIKELMKPAKPVEVGPPVGDDESEDEKNKNRAGSVIGRDKRHQQRAQRANQRKGREGEALDARKLLTGEDERPRHIKDRFKHKVKKNEPTKPRSDNKVPITLPITVRALSEALGIRATDLLFKLKDHGITDRITNNSTLDPMVAETLALDAGKELDIKRPLDAEEQLNSISQKPDNTEDLVLRAPIVTIMGHVDHGKTSLLDRIRQSNVVATEAGGITQVIRAWRVDHHGKPITFLDTPGHEAFTKMRARGANVTDIAVIVVAADDGVMPQTAEAISHARAAGVSLVVAINKIDLPNANLNRARQQLYSMNVLPDNMGGDVPFIETSAATGKGIDELLDMLSVVAELKELKANPNKPARGTCLEAMLSEGQGVLATLLVQDGTLHKGDVVLCGATYGRVRAMFDDLGRPIQEAGPSVPVRITGLDEVPNADDAFQAVTDLGVARGIAEKRSDRLEEASVIKRDPVRLENLAETKIAELKVILKADFRGSIEAIRKELEKLQHEEVRVRVLEAGIGGITENDVWLALTSPQDTLIVGFNVVPDDRARTVAEERGVQIRLYSIIYNLTDDIRSALEGKLKPREEVIHLGRAVVRDTFKISRVGTIAGCYVTTGVIERSAKVRVIREGVVIYPPAERTASLESLKHYKDDVREIKQGYECGIKVAGYDDIKVGDVIEAYRIEQVQRTLEK